MQGPVVIDLRLMRTVQIHPESKTAWADGGAIINDLDKEAFEYNLAGVGGQFWSTGEQSLGCILT